MKFLRFLLLTVAMAAAIAHAQSLSVTFPGNGEVLGKTNTIKFLAENANNQIRVVATATNDANTAIKFSNEAFFDPDAERRVLGSLDLNFDETTPAGVYTLVVQLISQGAVVRTQTVTNITVDTKNPRFRNVVPTSNAFVSSIVSIRATLDETNVDKWRVRVNDRDIPNNTGSGTDVSVTWDSSTVEADGPQSITLKVDDKAKNTATRTISVTLDRLSPGTTISSPTTVAYRPRAVIPVLIEIADQFQSSVASTGVNVVLRTMDGRYISKVARRSATSNQTSLLWIGRIRNSGRLPSQFKMVVTAVDRAGNRAQTQEIIVSIGAG